MVEYKLHYNSKYLVSLLEKKRNIGVSKFIRTLLKSICWIGLLSLLALIICSYIMYQKVEALYIAFVPTIFLALLAFGPKFDYLLLARKLKKSSSFNNEWIVTLSDDGITIRSELFNTKFEWAIFKTVYKFIDGHFLKLDNDTYIWLPADSMINGTIEDSDNIFRSRISIYHQDDVREKTKTT